MVILGFLCCSMQRRHASKIPTASEFPTSLAEVDRCECRGSSNQVLMAGFVVVPNFVDTSCTLLTMVTATIITNATLNSLRSLYAVMTSGVRCPFKLDVRLISSCIVQTVCATTTTATVKPSTITEDCCVNQTRESFREESIQRIKNVESCGY